MTSLKQIRESLQQLPDEELREISLAIVCAVSRRLSQEITGFWTIGEIATWIARDPSDTAVARSLQLLVAWRNAQLLDVHYIYYPASGLRPQGIKVDDNEVIDAYKTGFLVDPDTGEEIRNFEDVLQPYFVPANDLEVQPCA